MREEADEEYKCLQRWLWSFGKGILFLPWQRRMKNSQEHPGTKASTEAKITSNTLSCTSHAPRLLTCGTSLKGAGGKESGKGQKMGSPCHEMSSLPEVTST
mmetsp:Transcript_57501/g.122332  ORF Transcript_57501/g.122332 Transcript_57501/m.122332 type:complete len:101 (-) Transcript_57501:109-411(-)